MNKLNNKLIFLLLCQFLSELVFAFSTQNNLPECEACLEDRDNCFNDTLSNKLTIKSRGVEYIDLKLDELDEGKGSVVEISYIIVSTQGDSITVQMENNKDQYVLESRDNRVSCSYRKSLKLYKQDEKIAVHCNNVYYDCEVMYEISLLKPNQKENEEKMPGCDECIGNVESPCFESIYLPAHSWYYLYYEHGYEHGAFFDFLVSSHKKDKMRVEIQNQDGLFYLVSTRRDKVRCSDPQSSVPVRWKSPRIAVYCYNNYIGCKFSVFVRSSPMPDSRMSSLSGHQKFNNEKMMGYLETTDPKWSEWSEWSDCMENDESYKNGMGRRTRERQCIQTMVGFVNPSNVTYSQQSNINEMLKEADIPYCEGLSVEYQNCQLETMEHSWQNILIFVFIISALVLTLCREKKPRRPTIDTTYSYNSYNEDVIKSNGLRSPTSEVRRESASENSPLLNTYFRRYD